jgi:uncharacterized membrane protein
MFILNKVKKLFYIILGLIAYPLVALPAFADYGIDPCSSQDNNPISKVLCAINGQNSGIVIRNIVVFIIVLAVVVALLYLLYGGIKWITSKGEKSEVEAARNHITAAITGLIVVFLAIFIVSVVLALFGISFTNLNLPTLTSNVANPT